MADLFDLIMNIRKRPAMYLGQPSVVQMRAFLAGYIFARRQSKIPQTHQEQTFSMFQSWVQEKYKISSSQSWDRIILFFSQDERAALEQFFVLFDEFVESTQNSKAIQANQSSQLTTSAGAQN
ncbi:MAG: hypothetical protein ACFBSF_20300 [Leptolyngbyaceae cyanobacterium]